MLISYKTSKMPTYCGRCSWLQDD